MSSPALTRNRTAADTVAAPPAPRPATDVPAIDVPAPTPVVARYRFDSGTGSWWWSPEMFVLHGLPPGSTAPDTEGYLAHLDADDRGRVRSAVSTACATGNPFVLEARVVEADGRRRSVVLTGEPTRDAGGAVASVDGA